MRNKTTTAWSAIPATSRLLRIRSIYPAPRTNRLAESLKREVKGWILCSGDIAAVGIIIRRGNWPVGDDIASIGVIVRRSDGTMRDNVAAIGVVVRRSHRPMREQL